jgi:hypothetical protein
MASHAQDRPPAPRPTIRVGVTGHRTEGLADAGYDQVYLRDCVRRILSQIKDVATTASLSDQFPFEGKPRFQVVSPIAEGADRIIAEEGLKLGFELLTPLPFARQQYEKDFATHESRVGFRTLLQKASSVVELEGTRSQENKAYEAVGRWVLFNSDLLIAIWNGKAAVGVGGTGQIVAEALALGITTIWIKPKEEAALLNSLDPITLEPLDRLAQRLQEIVERHLPGAIL